MKQTTSTVARVARSTAQQRLGYIKMQGQAVFKFAVQQMAGSVQAALAKAGLTTADVDFVVGTTDLSSGRSNNYLRRSVSPERLGDLLRPLFGKAETLYGGSG